MWTLALRNLLRQRTRNAMTLLAIIVGVVGLILSGGFVHDIFKQLGETLIHSQSGHLQVARAGYFEKGTRSPEKYLIEDASELRRMVSSYTEVNDVMGRLYFSGLLNNGRTDLPIIAEGIEPEVELRLGSSMRLVAGRQLESKDEHGLMVGVGLARALKLKPGDWTTLVINTAEGALNSQEFEIVGVFQTFSKDYDARAARLTLPAAQEVMSTRGINTLVVALRHTEDTDPVATQLGPKLSAAGMEIKTWVQLNDFYAKTVDMYDAQFGVLRLIILLMVLLSVSNSVSMSVFERIGEFGTLQAIGNSKRNIFALIMAENALLGLVGAFMGVVIGILAAFVISAIGIPMPPPPNSDMDYVAHIQIVPSVMIGAFGVGFLATVIASVLPARRIQKTLLVDALRQNV